MSMIFETRRLAKYYPVRAGFFSRSSRFVRAVDLVNLDIRKGETVGLAGESGCGKTTLSRLLLRLETPTGGQILFKGKDIVGASNEELMMFRRQTQMVFQNPSASLNPRKKIGQIIRQPLDFHKVCKADTREQKVSELLGLVGLRPAENFIDRYPHELSGGQQQRVGIARAIATVPDCIVADEPVSSLDVSVRAQILNLLKELQGRFNISFLLVTHELAVLRSLAHRTAIMYLGQIVETGNTQDVFEKPCHPYTRALLSATPVPDPSVARSREKLILSGEVPSAIDPPEGCRFHPRCPFSKSKCSSLQPEAKEENGRLCMCHYPLS